ncbi:SWIB domain-containing protein/GYF domain-containing protein/Plus-3 domain-containing protein, partial [Cephalotus follicularis]
MDSMTWVEEYEDDKQQWPPKCRRKRTKLKGGERKMEYIGWGSKQLIEFLESIGRYTSTNMSRYDVATIITDYANENNLFNLNQAKKENKKKKKIACDERLHSLFGKKSISRIKIHDLLEPHFAENQDASDSDDDLFSFSDDEDNTKFINNNSKKKFAVEHAPKSPYAAVIPDNIRLVYLKRSLVEDLLLKDPLSLPSKLAGSFVRVKSDPNDYLQPNSHLLLQVTCNSSPFHSYPTQFRILLQLSNFMKDIPLSMLSDDNFSKEECEDLCQRVKDGLLKRPTVVELEEKARILHEDVTKHWLMGEIALLQKLIDRANEKGWRKESFTLFEYMERRQLLQTPDEQSRLLSDVPKVVADEVEKEATSQDLPHRDSGKKGSSGSPVFIHRGASEIHICDTVANGSSPAGIHCSTDFPESHEFVADNHDEAQNQSTEIKSETFDGIHYEDMLERQVIYLSDDEGIEDSVVVDPLLHEDLVSLRWHYADPQGLTQGPFSLTSLRRWWDDTYFPTDFKVWRMGQTQDEAVLLIDVLRTTL